LLKQILKTAERRLTQATNKLEACSRAGRIASPVLQLRALPRVKHQLTLPWQDGRMVLPLSSVSSLFGSARSSGGMDLSFITRGASGASPTAGPGAATLALANAAKHEAKQLADLAKDPQIVRDLARYEKVLKNARSINDVLDDPVARKVLMTATGLKSDVDNIALLKKALLSDPADKKSLAVRMSTINDAWLAFAREYDLAKYGLDRLYPQMDGVKGRWSINIDREGEPLEAMLEIKQTRGGLLQAQVDGVPIPITVNGTKVTFDLLWRDAKDEIHTTRLTGTLGKDSMSGVQYDDGVKVDASWKAKPYFADALKEISDNYIAEKRLDMLDAQLPGLGSAVLFKQMAKNLKNATDVLGSPLGREVITVAFSIPKQIAVQPLIAQERVINQRMNPAKLAESAYANTVAERYLMMRNGGVGGVTA
jgi:hypothetical protein